VDAGERMEAAAEGGGHILHTAGQVFSAKPGNIETMAEAVILCGSYR
jgi:hypothetical protein